MNELQSPEYYHQQLLGLRRANRYAKRWKAKLETHTNRHPNCDGSPWGWYEVWPLDEEVGHWSGRNKGKRDDLGLKVMPITALGVAA